MPRWSFFALLLAAAPALGAGPAEIVVKLRAEGPDAVGECAEHQWRTGRPLAASLDRLHEEHRVRRVRALFRRPDGRPFAAQRTGPLRDLAHVYVLSLPAGSSAERVAGRYARDPHVVWAQPNFAARAEALPDDPFLGSQGSWGQPFADLWGLHRMRVEEAWARTRGEGVVVAVVDSGLDLEHPEIAANVYVNPGEERNGIDDDGNGLVDDVRGFDFTDDTPEPWDEFGHGTHVAGTVAAVADNATGIAGVAPGARVLALKALDETGTGTIADLSRAIVHAAQAGARVINNSWSCGVRCPSSPVAEEAVRTAHALGAVVVFSAGNAATDAVFFSPKQLPEAVVVAALNPADEPPHFSNRGFVVSVAAPGAGLDAPPPGFLPAQGILSLRSAGISPVLDREGQLAVGTDYLRLAGTSMAAPHVAGVAALILSAHPELGPDEVRTVLRLSAQDVGPLGRDVRTGFGMVDAARALELADRLPRVRARIQSPAPLARLRPARGEVEIAGTAAGADFGGFALFLGAGTAPDTWQPLPAAGPGPVEDGLLGRWRTAGAGQGAYVVRLDVFSRDGHVLQEFAQVSLEHVEPARVSSAGPAALEPAVSGDRVAWQSRRSERQQVFVTDLRWGEELALPDTGGNQRFARLSGALVVWEATEPGHGVRAYSCALDRRRDTCLARTLLPEVRARSRLSLSRRRLAWAESPSGPLQLFVCTIDAAGGCAPERVAPSLQEQDEPDLGGVRLVWLEGFRALTCRIVPDTRSCRPTSIPPDDAFQFRARASGDRVAWLHIAERSELRVCVVDPATGACPAVTITPATVSTGTPELSGRRVVWHDSVGDEDLDVFFCEHDPVTGTCPVQRLTAELSAQAQPEIDGTRVVFEDQRDGDWAIATRQLPSLDPIGDRRIRSGRLLVIHVRGRDPEGGRLRIDAATAVGARLRAAGPGRAVFWWRPRPADVGTHVVVFRGIARSGLVTREAIRIHVDP